MDISPWLFARLAVTGRSHFGSQAWPTGENVTFLSDCQPGPDCCWKSIHRTPWVLASPWMRSGWCPSRTLVMKPCHPYFSVPAWGAYRYPSLGPHGWPPDNNIKRPGPDIVPTIVLHNQLLSRNRLEGSARLTTFGIWATRQMAKYNTRGGQL